LNIWLRELSNIIYKHIWVKFRWKWIRKIRKKLFFFHWKYFTQLLITFYYGTWYNKYQILFFYCCTWVIQNKNKKGIYRGLRLTIKVKFRFKSIVFFPIYFIFYIEFLISLHFSSFLKLYFVFELKPTSLVRYPS